MDRVEKPKVLIVEDELVIARNIARYLDHLGYAVAGVCSSAGEVMSAIKECRPDVVLMDIRIEGSEDGIVVAERLYDLHHIPVVYLSALIDDETVRRVKATQPFGFLAKPFSQKELQITLEIALYKAEMERRLSEQEIHIQKLIERMAQGFCLLDGQRRVRYANQAFGLLVGRLPAELVGHPVDRWVELPASGSGCHQAWIDQRAFETTVRPQAGQERRCILTAQHLFDAAGSCSGRFISLTDLEGVVRDAAGPERAMMPASAEAERQKSD